MNKNELLKTIEIESGQHDHVGISDTLLENLNNVLTSLVKLYNLNVKKLRIIYYTDFNEIDIRNNEKDQIKYNDILLSFTVTENKFIVVKENDTHIVQLNYNLNEINYDEIASSVIILNNDEEKIYSKVQKYLQDLRRKIWKKK